jgi:hypothetical protein
MQFYYPHSEDTVLWIITRVSLENRALPVVNTNIVSWQHICSNEKYLFFREYCNLDLCRQYKWCTFNDIVIAIRPQWLQKNRAIEEKLSVGTISRYRKCQRFMSTFRDSSSYKSSRVRQYKNAIKYYPTPRNIPEERKPQLHRRGSLKRRADFLLLFKRVALQPKEDKPPLSL